MLDTCAVCDDLVDVDHRSLPDFDGPEQVLCGYDKCLKPAEERCLCQKCDKRCPELRIGNFGDPEQAYRQMACEACHLAETERRATAKMREGLTDYAKMLLKRVDGRIIPCAMDGSIPGRRDVVWVDINKFAQAQVDMNTWVANRLGDIWGEEDKDKPAYAWHLGANGPPLCGIKMEANPLEHAHEPPFDHRCTECKRIWHDLHYITEGEAPA